ncbi:MAG: hypothetical protein OXI83_03405, partial [Gemmatimonadota bacterium]|nr:hypothetical protein [Gemmatimonadota bacterium]
MTTTRRDFLKSAALAATVPTLASAAACAPDSPAGPGAGQGTSSLQADLEEALARHRVVGASAAVFANGEILTAAAGLVNVT